LDAEEKKQKKNLDEIKIENFHIGGRSLERNEEGKNELEVSDSK